MKISRSYTSRRRTLTQTFCPWTIANSRVVWSKANTQCDPPSDSWRNDTLPGDELTARSIETLSSTYMREWLGSETTTRHLPWTRHKNLSFNSICQLPVVLTLSIYTKHSLNMSMRFKRKLKLVSQLKLGLRYVCLIASAHLAIFFGELERANPVTSLRLVPDSAGSAPVKLSYKSRLWVRIITQSKANTALMTYLHRLIDRNCSWYSLTAANWLEQHPCFDLALFM